MSFVRIGLTASGALIVLLATACSTQPISEEVVARAEADCQVTGSNLKRKSTECASARKQAGVLDVSPEEIQAITAKSGAKSVGMTGGGQ
jgi:hypothetical protein